MYQKITISGLICTGKSTLFASLQKELSWPAFSASQYFRHYSKVHKLSLEKAEEQREEITKRVDLHMKDLLLKTGNVLLEGWMAGIMADALPGVLRVFLVCQDAVRIKRFSERNRVSEPAARQLVHEREQNLLHVLGQIYGRSDFVDRKKYNCVVDTTHATSEEVHAMVLAHLARTEVEKKVS